MGIKKYNPTTPGLRGMTVSTFEEITKHEPEKSLLAPLKKTGGRNNSGRLTTRHQGGGHKGETAFFLKVMKDYPNLYLDTCGSIANAMSIWDMALEAGEDRLVYGSDILYMEPRYELGKIVFSGMPEELMRKIFAENYLKLLEGSVVNVPPQGGRKHPEQEFIHVDTRNILFICGGAFDGIERKIAQRMNTQVVGFDAAKKAQQVDKSDLLQYIAPQDLKSFGLIPEIIGRLPILTYLNPLDRDALLRILIEPKNSIIKQYIKLFAMDGVELTIEDDVKEFIVDKAIEYKLGARGLRSIAESIMMDAMYDVPSSKKKKLIYGVSALLDTLCGIIWP